VIDCFCISPANRLVFLWKKNMEKEKNQQITRAYERIVRPWTEKGLEPPCVSVKQLSREARIQNPGALVNQLANGGATFGSNGSVDSRLVLEDLYGEPVENIEQAAREAAPYKRAVKEADYRSRAPGGGPVVKRRINEKSLARKLMQLGKGRLKVGVERYCEDEERMLSRQETKQRIAQRWVGREVLPEEGTTEGKSVLERFNLTPSATNEFIKIRNLTESRNSLGFGKENYTNLEYLDLLNCESEQRGRLASNICESLLERFDKDYLNSFDSVVGIPVVGFASQSPIFERTLSQLSKLEGRNLFILLVNYPETEREDDTAKYLAKYAEDVDSVVAMSEVITKPVMMGDIRSSIFDGYLLASGLIDQERLRDKTFLVLDDDFVDVPRDWITTSQEIFERDEYAGIVLPNTKFELPQFIEVPEGYKMSEELRQLIASDILREIGTTATSDTTEDRTESLFGWSVEGFCYSGMAVRASAYYRRKKGYCFIYERWVYYDKTMARLRV
jgi:hypothetical protein